MLSTLPSLMPRPWYAQAALTAVCVLLGYLALVPVDVLLRRLPSSQLPRVRAARDHARRVLLAATVIGGAVRVRRPALLPSQ